jgi:hypothetical protein
LPRALAATPSCCSSPLLRACNSAAALPRRLLQRSNAAAARLLQHCRSNASCSSVATTPATTVSLRSRDWCYSNNVATLPRRELQKQCRGSLATRVATASLRCATRAAAARACIAAVQRRCPPSSQRR